MPNVPLRRERGAGQGTVAVNRGPSSTLGHGATDVSERRVDGTFREILTPLSAMRVPQEFRDITVSNAGAYRRRRVRFSMTPRTFCADARQRSVLGHMERVSCSIRVFARGARSADRCLPRVTYWVVGLMTRIS